MDGFLRYLSDWKHSVTARSDFSQGEKGLSNETIEGLHTTGTQWRWIVHNSCILAVRSFVEVVRYLPGVTERECFSQDPLENYLGQLRACGGRSGNPTVRASLESAQSLKVAGHATRSWELQQKRRLFQGQEIVDETPLRGGRRKDACMQTLFYVYTLCP